MKVGIHLFLLGSFSRDISQFPISTLPCPSLLYPSRLYSSVLCSTLEDLEALLCSTLLYAAFDQSYSGFLKSWQVAFLNSLNTIDFPEA